MPVDVGTFSTEVTLQDGDTPLSSSQVERLVQTVMQRLDQRERARQHQAETTSIRRGATPQPHLA